MKNSDQWAAVDSKMTPAQDSVSHRGRFNKPFLYTEPFLIFYISTATLKASNTVYIEHNLLFTVIIVINDTSAFLSLFKYELWMRLFNLKE